MDERYADDWIARLERISGLTAWHGRSRRSALIYLFLYAVAFAGAALFILSPEGPAIKGGRWFYASLVLGWTTYVLSAVGHALCVGTFGRRHEPQGRMLRTVAALGAIPAGFLLFAAIGYMMFGAAGAVVAGALGLLLQAAILLHESRGRTPDATDPDDPDFQHGGSHQRIKRG